MDSKAYLNLIRPKQWIKNFFVMVPLFFGGELFDVKSLIAGAITFMAYSFAASSIYCYNDIHDVDDDRRHPAKCTRPVASGAVSVFQAYILMGLMILLSMICITFLPENNIETGGVILFYWVLNIAYCAKLKRYAIVDVCIVAFGFVLRLFAGGFASDILLSKWIVLMTFLITLFMSFAKRRDDVLRMEETGEAPRHNTIRYNLTFINQAITITASVTLVCYIMYTVSPEVIEHFHTDYLYLTSVFVLLGLLRYIQLAVVDKESGDPTKIILKDHFTQLVVFAWLISFLIIIYVFKR
ncbi:MAG: decaprenyl-phosphate phosphoribosyltransferase [Prevotella sp.]|jgi:4-hydroxybenzoate polyprenyltransferase|nr:decaprenyl-phosphate phosphoribosyltransferase [Prevotella sp.]MBP9983620.1 decaprenyl-phosphate phosphoribosyltransferase [Prevotella sp.]MDY0153011.1 decaprenyl-phosphate phosphoribosyltransferase [Prevotella sp.]